MKNMVLALFLYSVLLGCESTEGILGTRNLSVNEIYIPSELSNCPDNISGIPEESRNIIYVSTSEELEKTQEITKSGNMTVLLKDGVYVLNFPLMLTGDNLTYRSESGMRENVIISGGMSLRGTGGTSSVFEIAGNGFTLKDVSVGRAKKHGVHIIGESENSTDSAYIFNVCFFDIKEQMIIASWSSSLPKNHADGCVVEYCLFENSSEISGRQNCGGIDVGRGFNWRIKGNIFKNLKNSKSSSDVGTIRFNNHSDGTIIKNNIIINCDQGIVLGTEGSPHYNGIILNNMITVSSDAGISLFGAVNTKILNNSIITTGKYSNSIEVHSSSEGSIIMNNLTNSEIIQYGTSAVKLSSNFSKAESGYFKNAAAGDLHLSPHAIGAIDMGRLVGDVAEDIDWQSRNYSVCDIGADEAF